MKDNKQQSRNSPFRAFQHQEMLSAAGTQRPWDQNKLVNKLNHLNFIDGFIFILLHHKETGKYFVTKASPQPCVKDELHCLLESQNLLTYLTNDYICDYLMIDDGLTSVLSPVQLTGIEGDMLKLKLPDASLVITLRKTRRHCCKDIDCRLIQDNFDAQGKLIDFTPTAMGINLNGDQNISGFNENNPVELILYKNAEKLYTGPCRCIRNGTKSPDGKIVFAPLSTHMERFPKRKMRNPRQHITPSFSLRFKHPFFQNNVERDIQEISTAGFSIRDNLQEEILLSGMLIPEISIIYAGVLKIACSVQVLYRREDKINNILQYGFAITDMDVKSYSNLNHILGAHIDSNARVSIEVDMDALWEFFFDTGFIYGEKYEHLYSYRNNFKETYKKLYQDNPDIARHFVYEKNGKIYGHIAMVHAYNPSWLIQHFSARQFQSMIPAFMILKQITSYINSFHRFPSGGMNYVMTYYQHGNKLIDTIFGGFARYLNNPKGSSLDLFAYILFNKYISNIKLPDEWNLKNCTLEDYRALIYFYETYSGGLMLDAFDLNSSMQQLIKDFTIVGFERNLTNFCLYNKDKQVAYFIVNRSNFGLNLSDLLNCITIIITNQNKLNIDVFFSIVNKLSAIYQDKTIPLLIYPSNYLSDNNIIAEKKYQLWILNNDPFSDNYTEYMDKKFRMKYNRSQ